MYSLENLIGIEGADVLVGHLTVYAHTKFGQFIVIILMILEMLFLLFLPTGNVTI